jgi:hypothetical protein
MMKFNEYKFAEYKLVSIGRSRVFTQIGMNFPDWRTLHLERPERLDYQKSTKYILLSPNGMKRSLFAGLKVVSGWKGWYFSDWNGGFLLIKGNRDSMGVFYWKDFEPSSVESKHFFAKRFLNHMIRKAS